MNSKSFMGKRNFSIPIATTLLLGTFLRFLHLGAKSLRFEEQTLTNLATVLDGRIFLKHFKELVGYGWNPLNPFFCRLVKNIGTGEAILRLPAAFFGVLSIYVLYRLGRSLYSEETGIIAAILLAFSPMAVAWSQDARYPSLALLICLFSTLFLVEALNGRKQAWLGFTLAQGALFLTTYQGVTIIVTEGIFLSLPVIIPALRRERDQNPLESFIYFGVSIFITSILLSPWFYYEIINDFRTHKVVLDILAAGGDYKSFLDWGGGSLAGFAFCSFFFLFPTLGMGRVRKLLGGEEPAEKGDKTSRFKAGRRGLILPVMLTGVPFVLALAGVLRRDQIFWGLPFFLLVTAEGMSQAATLFNGKRAKQCLIFTVFLYLLLQTTPFYNLETNRKLSFIPKPDWRGATTYLLPQFLETQTVISENKRDQRSFFWYLGIIKNQLGKKTAHEKYYFPYLKYLEKDIFATFQKNRNGFFIQTSERGKNLVADQLISSFFTPLASFAGLKVYRYSFPALVLENTHFHHDKTINDMTITRSQDFHKPVLIPKEGDYMVAFKTIENIQGRFSITVNNRETINISTDANGFGSFHVQARRELLRFVFRLLEPDEVRLKWFGLHHMRNDRIAFEAEDFHFQFPIKHKYRIISNRGRKIVSLFPNDFVEYYFALAQEGKFLLNLEGFNNKLGKVKIAAKLDGKQVGVLSFDEANRKWNRRQISLSMSAGLHRISFSNNQKSVINPNDVFFDRFELTRISPP